VRPSRAQTIFTTLPLRRQRVQIFMVVWVLPTIVWILRRLGFQTLRVLFFAWLTLFPVTVPLPHISHLRAIYFLPWISVFLDGTTYRKYPDM
jgi:hypothetical protein